MIAVAKCYGSGRLVCTGEGKHDLIPVLRPVSTLRRIVFSYVQGGQQRGAVSGEVEGVDAPRCILRRGATPIGAGNAAFLSEGGREGMRPGFHPPAEPVRGADRNHAAESRHKTRISPMLPEIYIHAG